MQHRPYVRPAQIEQQGIKERAWSNIVLTQLCTEPRRTHRTSAIARIIPHNMNTNSQPPGPSDRRQYRRLLVSTYSSKHMIAYMHLILPERIKNSSCAPVLSASIPPQRVTKCASPRNAVTTFATSTGPHTRIHIGTPPTGLI